MKGRSIDSGLLFPSPLSVHFFFNLLFLVPFLIFVVSDGSFYFFKGCFAVLILSFLLTPLCILFKSFCGISSIEFNSSTFVISKNVYLFFFFYFFYFFCFACFLTIPESDANLDLAIFNSINNFNLR